MPGMRIGKNRLLSSQNREADIRSGVRHCLLSSSFIHLAASCHTRPTASSTFILNRTVTLPRKTRRKSHSPSCRQRWAPSLFPTSRPSRASCQRRRHHRVYRGARIARDRWLGSRCELLRSGMQTDGRCVEGSGKLEFRKEWTERGTTGTRADEQL